MSAVQTEFDLTVRFLENNTIAVEPIVQQVNNVPAGDMIVLTWLPFDETVQIMGVTGFPSNVSVTGPDGEGKWMATYPAVSVHSPWAYTVHAQYRPTLFRARHDPEVDNTPPVGPG